MLADALIHPGTHPLVPGFIAVCAADEYRWYYNARTFRQPSRGRGCAPQVTRRGMAPVQQAFMGSSSSSSAGWGREPPEAASFRGGQALGALGPAGGFEARGLIYAS